MESRFEPGQRYVYEHVDGVTYARKSGDPVSSRFEIGRTWERVKHDADLKRQALWENIYKAAEDNPALQKAIDECILLYYLSKKDGSKT